VLALVLLPALGLLALRWDALHAQGELDSIVSRESAFLLNNVLLVAAAFTVFFGTVFPLLSEAARGVKVSVGAPFFNQVNVPLFLALIFLMGVGPLIAWRRASFDNLRRNFLWPVLVGVAAAAFFFSLGVRSAIAVLVLALTVFVASTITVDFARASRARVRLGEPLLPAMGGLLRRHNRRYGGFGVHLGILIIAVGVTGSQAWSVQTETTLRRGEYAELAGYRVRFEDLTASEESNHFKVAGAFPVSNGRGLGVLRPALPVLALLAYGFRVNPREIPSPLVGRPAPGFVLTTFAGAPLTLEAQRGRVVVVNFWASWCHPACYEEAPVLERSWRAYRDRGVVVVGVDIQDKAEAAQKFIRDFGLSFPNAPDPTGKVSVDSGTYGVPETFFIDPPGRIRAKHVGALTDEVLRTRVEPLLGEPAG